MTHAYWHIKTNFVKACQKTWIKISLLNPVWCVCASFGGAGTSHQPACAGRDPWINLAADALGTTQCGKQPLSPCADLHGVIPALSLWASLNLKTSGGWETWISQGWAQVVQRQHTLTWLSLCHAAPRQGLAQPRWRGGHSQAHSLSPELPQCALPHSTEGAEIPSNSWVLSEGREKLGLVNNNAAGIAGYPGTAFWESVLS